MRSIIINTHNLTETMTHIRKFKMVRKKEINEIKLFNVKYKNQISFIHDDIMLYTQYSMKTLKFVEINKITNIMDINYFLLAKYS